MGRQYNLFGEGEKLTLINVRKEINQRKTLPMTRDGNGMGEHRGIFFVSVPTHISGLCPRPVLHCRKTIPHLTSPAGIQSTIRPQREFLPVIFSFLCDIHITIWVLNERSRYPTTLTQLFLQKRTLVSFMDCNYTRLTKFIKV